jgi:hypothetical protein
MITIQFHQETSTKYNTFVTGALNEKEAMVAFEAFAMMNNMHVDCENLHAIDIGPTVFKIEEKTNG